MCLCFCQRSLAELFQEYAADGNDNLELQEFTRLVFENFNFECVRQRMLQEEKEDMQQALETERQASVVVAAKLEAQKSEFLAYKRGRNAWVTGLIKDLFGAVKARSDSELLSVDSFTSFITERVRDSGHMDLLCQALEDSDNSLDELFLKYDVDGSASLELVEFTSMLLDHFDFDRLRERMQEQEKEELRHALEKERRRVRMTPAYEEEVVGSGAVAGAEVDPVSDGKDITGAGGREDPANNEVEEEEILTPFQVAKAQAAAQAATFQEKKEKAERRAARFADARDAARAHAERSAEFQLFLRDLKRQSNAWMRDIVEELFRAAAGVGNGANYISHDKFVAFVNTREMDGSHMDILCEQLQHSGVSRLRLSLSPLCLRLIN